jgi:hypothetical protein
MITQERTNTVQTHGIKDTVSFGIKQDGLAHIFSVLRNQLYSDKILAVIREYTCNGVDAHTEAGKPTEPIVVTLPTRWETTFKCRDFGLGLSDADIHDIYAFYGESTKRKSNAMIGQLGLGSKSAFAYGDNFVITSFVDGVKNTYNAFIDASQIGQIAKLASEPTTEPNGVEISIAVKDYDVQAFHNKAYELFRYFKVRPVVHGATLTYESKTPIMKGSDWAIYGQSGQSVAIMGNIGYPIDNHWNDDNITNALSAGLEVDFNIGDLEISASREKLQYTDRTKKAIKDKLARVVQEVSAELNARFKSCATLFDAHKLYGTIMDYGSNLYVLRGMVKSSLQFNGQPVTSATLHFSEPVDGNFSMRQYEKTWRGNKVKSWSYSEIKCADTTVLVDNDLNISAGITNRVWNMVQNGQKVYVLSYRTAQDRADFLADSGLEDSNFIKLSSLPKISLATATGAAPKNAKHSSKEFIYDFNYAANASSWHRKNSDFWAQEVVDVANDAGVYVILDAFKYQGKDGGFDTPNELNNIIKSLATFGITLPKIFGFKEAKRAVVEANPNMVSLWAHIETELTNYFAANKIAQKLANRLEYDRNENHSWLHSAPKLVKAIDAKTVFAKNYEKFAYMKSEKDKAILDEAVKWKAYYSATEKPENDLAALATEIEATYPLFAHVRYWETDKAFIAAMSQYVNLIDG